MAYQINLLNNLLKGKEKLSNFFIFESPKKKSWVPVYADQNQKFAVMSIGFLLSDPDSAVIWRGPKKNGKKKNLRFIYLKEIFFFLKAMIKQFVDDVLWGQLDYLIVDTPPGTSDEHLSVLEHLKQFNPDGAVLVTTPQNVSISDVRREITFCKKLGLPILGLVENMSGFVCPYCTVSTILK